MNKYNFDEFSEKYKIKSLKFSRAESVFSALCNYSKTKSISEITKSELINIAKDNMAATPTYMYASHYFKVVKYFYSWMSDFDGVVYKLPSKISANEILLSIFDFSSSHYRNLDDAVDSIINEKITSKDMKPSPIYDAEEVTTIFDMIACTAILFWNGFTIDQIIDVKKSDITGKGVILDGNLVDIQDNHLNILNSVANAECYTPFTRSRYAVFVDSEYLLRNHKIPKFKRTTIFWMISRYNQYVEKHNGRSINLMSLKSDKNFSCLKSYEDSGMSIAKALRRVYKENFSENSISYFENYFIPTYNIWRDVFYRD